MTVNHEGSKIVIKNFLGERVPRIAKILDGVKVQIDKDIITLSGSSIEAVGQSAGNLEKSTRITNRDRRRFQDGIYITSKAEEPKE
jgi:large subunit ribosomal protein L6